MFKSPRSNTHFTLECNQFKKIVEKSTIIVRYSSLSVATENGYMNKRAFINSFFTSCRTIPPVHLFTSSMTESEWASGC